MHSSSGVPTSLATSSLAVTWSRGMQAVADEATALARLFGKHEWLTRCWLTSFCTENIFSKLQPATQAALLSLSDEELQRLATDLPVRPEWPDELTELLNAARRIAPPATARRGESADAELPNKFFFRGLPRTRMRSPRATSSVQCSPARRALPTLRICERRRRARSVSPQHVTHSELFSSALVKGEALDDVALRLGLDACQIVRRELFIRRIVQAAHRAQQPLRRSDHLRLGCHLARRP